MNHFFWKCLRHTETFVRGNRTGIGLVLNSNFYSCKSFIQNCSSLFHDPIIRKKKRPRVPSWSTIQLQGSSHRKHPRHMNISRVNKAQTCKSPGLGHGRILDSVWPWRILAEWNHEKIILYTIFRSD